MFMLYEKAANDFQNLICSHDLLQSVVSEINFNFITYATQVEI